MRLIDADVLERDGWRMSRIVPIDEKTMELQTRKPTDFPAVEPQPEPEQNTTSEQPVSDKLGVKTCKTCTDTISRQDAYDTLTDYYHHTTQTQHDALRDALSRVPSVQPERKTGFWIDMGDFEQCSVCYSAHLKIVQTMYGKTTWIKTPYCPNCGARLSHDNT